MWRNCFDGKGLCLLFPDILNSYGTEALQQKNTLANKACLYKKKGSTELFEDLKVENKELRFVVVKKHIADAMVRYQSLTIPKGYLS